MNTNTMLEQIWQTFYMRGVNVDEILYMDPIPVDVYFYHKGHFNVLLQKSESLSHYQWDQLVKNVEQKKISLFCINADRINIDLYFQHKLREMTRSLSMDFSKEKIEKFTPIFMHTMHQLYLHPYDHDVLEVFYQATKVPCAPLISAPNMICYMYYLVDNSRYHYSIKQPIMASLILLGFMAYSKQFSMREIENLFLVSMLKDIGICLWPKHLLSKSQLTQDELTIIHSHPKESLKILSNRVPLSSNYLTILANHHDSVDPLGGLEVKLVHLTDSLVAIIQNRPYRDQMNLFSALNIIKSTLPTQYNQEYKLIVLFLQNFFKKVSSFSSP